ncbi:ARS-binding protein 2, partial [Neolecta irregularis DAH-3]
SSPPLIYLPRKAAKLLVTSLVCIPAGPDGNLPPQCLLLPVATMQTGAVQDIHTPEDERAESALAASSNIAENFARLQQSLLQPIPGLSNYRFSPTAEQKQQSAAPPHGSDSRSIEQQLQQFQRLAQASQTRDGHLPPLDPPVRPSTVPADRSLPNRNISHDSIADAYIQFMMYCNPSVPSDAKSDELATAFKLPPKSDGKAFDIFVLYQLIKQLDQGEIKTWTKLAQDLGVERKDEQSPQKVQQYAVRLKRWMHAMHIDSFFEYCMGKPHNYYLEIPDASAIGVIRDGVPLEEDLALRALHPESRPKRGRRRTDELGLLTEEHRETKRSRDDDYGDDSLLDDQIKLDDDLSDRFETDNIKFISAAKSTGGSTQWAQNLANWTAVPSTVAFPETKLEPAKRKRRHGPQVSSAWSTTSAAPAGARPRGRPPGTKNRLSSSSGVRPSAASVTPSPVAQPTMLNISTPDVTSARASPTPAKDSLNELASPTMPTHFPYPTYMPLRNLFHSQDAKLKASLVAGADLEFEQSTQVHDTLARILDDSAHAAPGFSKHEMPLGFEDTSNSVFASIGNLLACGELIDVNMRPVQMSTGQAVAGATHFLSFRIRQGGMLMSFSHEVIVDPVTGDMQTQDKSSLDRDDNELEQLRKKCAFLEARVAKSDGQLEKLKRDVFQSYFSSLLSFFLDLYFAIFFFILLVAFVSIASLCAYHYYVLWFPLYVPYPIMSNQASFLLEKHGKFAIQNTELYTPAANEVVIKVIAAAINPVDWKITDYGIFVTSYPCILGSDVAGVVESIGSDVSNVKKGDRVLALCAGLVSGAKYGGFQRYVPVYSHCVTKIPDAIGFDEASAIPLAIATAAVGFFEPDGLQLERPSSKPAMPKERKQTLLVWGGASSVGVMAIQLANHACFPNSLV